jgi:putative transposase
MPWTLKRFQDSGDLHFITFSCNRRKPLLASGLVRVAFLKELERLRKKYGFNVFGFVLMPEHVHLLISEPEIGSFAAVLQVLKQNVSRKLKDVDGGQLWQRRYYDFNVRTDKKKIEKLKYIHRNPIARGLVENPEDWKWSSFSHYLTGEIGIVEIESQWTIERRKSSRAAEEVNNPTLPN